MLLLDMLKYRRPEGSASQTIFCLKFLEPVMGKPDAHGNYILVVGDNPDIAFMAHHDTVHTVGGLQKLQVKDDIIRSNADCLGADCTTGVWLILEMIKAQVPGVYVVHAAEEIGCKGSSALVNDAPPWLDNIKAAISFDRYGTRSIITHQMGMRTASDDFSVSLAEALGMDMVADPNGSYTDSNEYASIVPECTNISVGYYDQHSSKETQDLNFAYELRDALISADFSALVISRDPSVREYDDDYWGWGHETSFRTRQAIDSYDIHGIVYHFPEEVAALFEERGVEPHELLEMIGLANPNQREVA